MERRGHGALVPRVRRRGVRSSRLAIRDIIRYGDPRLLAANDPVDPAAEDLSALIADLVQTCHAAPGIGLAADDPLFAPGLALERIRAA